MESNRENEQRRVSESEDSQEHRIFFVFIGLVAIGDW